MALDYHLPEPAATAIPVLTGHYLARNRESCAIRAFFGADLHLGARRFGRPTRLQSAYLARVSPAYVLWAERRQEQRAAIERGLIPLVPPQYVAPKTNGSTLPVTSIDDAVIMNFVRTVGVNRVLEAAVAVEAAQ